jgi:hypothetical protein
VRQLSLVGKDSVGGFSKIETEGSLDWLKVEGLPGASVDGHFRTELPHNNSQPRSVFLSHSTPNQ